MVAPSAASAAESGLGNFPFGAQTSYAALMPPPGTTSFFGYALFYKAGSVRDNAGNKVPDLEFEVLALAPRLVHTWSQGWAGFNLSSGVVFQGLNVKIQAGASQDSKLGAGLVAIEPLYLTRSFAQNTFHVLTGPLIYFPAGSYDPNALANTTVGYKSFAYQTSTTWTPTPRWDVSLNAAVEWKRENDETDYRSGTQGGLTFGVGHRPFADTRWDLGISGFYTDAFSDDRQNGVKVPGGGRTKKLALGPKLVYWFSPGAAIVAQYHREMDVRNAGDGDLFWLECAFPI